MTPSGVCGRSSSLFQWREAPWELSLPQAGTHLQLSRLKQWVANQANQLGIPHRDMNSGLLGRVRTLTGRLYTNPDQYYWYQYSGPLYFSPIVLVAVLYGLHLWLIISNFQIITLMSPTHFGCLMMLLYQCLLDAYILD